MNILVVEDEPKTRAYLEKGFREAGFSVITASDAAEGAVLLEESRVDLLVCDVMLPGKDGWSFVRQLRNEGWDTPAIFLTARDSVADRVTGLDAGGDDYLVKPFAFSELLARVRALLRRRGGLASSVLTTGDLTVDPLRRTARRASDTLHLTPREFSLLQLLMERSGEVLTRTEIAETVWDMNFDTDTNVVDVAIRRLRQKVDDPYTTKLIQTVRGAGYVLRASP